MQSSRETASIISEVCLESPFIQKSFHNIAKIKNIPRISKYIVIRASKSRTISSFKTGVCIIVAYLAENI